MKEQYERQGARPKESRKKHTTTTTTDTPLTIMTLNIHGTTTSQFESKLQSCLNGERRVDIALLQEVRGKDSIVNKMEEEFDVIQGDSKVGLCILLRKGTVSKVDQKNGDINAGEYLCCHAKWEDVSLFIVNLHIKHVKNATSTNILSLNDVIKNRKEELIQHEDFLWILGGDFNFLTRAEDKDALKAENLSWFRHYFIAQLPPKDVYPRSLKPVRTVPLGRNDRLYVDVKLLDGVDSVWTGEMFSDHRPVFFSTFHREKKCHCCNVDNVNEFVRCSGCCKWVCDSDRCRSQEKMRSERAFPPKRRQGDTALREWAARASHSEHGNLDGAVDGAKGKDIGEAQKRENEVNWHTKTELWIYTCKNCGQPETPAPKILELEMLASWKESRCHRCDEECDSWNNEETEKVRCTSCKRVFHGTCIRTGEECLLSDCAEMLKLSEAFANILLSEGHDDLSRPRGDPVESASSSHATDEITPTSTSSVIDV